MFACRTFDDARLQIDPPRMQRANGGRSGDDPVSERPAFVWASVVDGEKAIAQVEERDLSIANPHGAPLARWNIFSGCNPDPMFVIHARTFSMAWIVTNWVA